MSIKRLSNTHTSADSVTLFQKIDIKSKKYVFLSHYSFIYFLTALAAMFPDLLEQVI